MFCKSNYYLFESRERLKKYEGDVHIQQMENYNMVQQPSVGDEGYNNQCQAQPEYTMTGHSSSRNAPKTMEDDLNRMADT